MQRWRRRATVSAFMLGDGGGEWAVYDLVVKVKWQEEGIGAGRAGWEGGFLACKVHRPAPRAQAQAQAQEGHGCGCHGPREARPPGPRGRPLASTCARARGAGTWCRKPQGPSKN
jgi:hypothetical protein